MRTEKKLWRNRKARKELARRLQSENPGLEVVHPHAAGFDMGNTAHYVAVRPDRDSQPVRRFECFTADLHRLAQWLHSCGVQTVALQSTGVYWIPLYDILEEQSPYRSSQGESPSQDGTDGDAGNGNGSKRRLPCKIAVASPRGDKITSPETELTSCWCSALEEPMHEAKQMTMA